MAACPTSPSAPQAAAAAAAEPHLLRPHLQVAEVAAVAQPHPHHPHLQAAAAAVAVAEEAPPCLPFPLPSSPAGREAAARRLHAGVAAGERT